MKITAKIQLRPTADQSRALLATLHRANECANWLSAEAWKIKVFQYFKLQKTQYHPAKQTFGLAAQLTVRVFAKVCDAYKLDKKVQRRFSATGSIAYDDRILHFRNNGTVNIWTLEGRQAIPFVAGPRQIEQLKQRQGESDLIYHRGKWFLACVCNVIEPPVTAVDDWLGVDFGIAQIATTSDGDSFDGGTVKGVRYRHRKLRTKLQKKGTQGARRKLRKLSGRERRFARDTNHCISKALIAKAKGTCRGISIENLKGVSKRVTVRRAQRAVLKSWSFDQLRLFIEYKGRMVGVPVITVDPRNSSRQCSQCGHIDKKNRRSQSQFSCTACGYKANADFNASRNLSRRASTDKPNVTQKTAVIS